MAELPLIASWDLYDPKFPGNAGLGELSIDFRGNTGSLVYQQQTVRLTTITRLSPSRFGARYDQGRFKGLVEGEIDDSRVLHLKFIGTPSALCDGRPKQSGEEWIAVQFKGSYDIAGAALALMQANSPIEWTNAGSDFTDARSILQLLRVRRMCCYEFVHFAAYLAGQQPAASTGNPKVSSSAGSVYTALKYTEWDRESVIPRNKIVVGVARAFNNTSGYYHVGVSIGDGRVISLSGGTNIHLEAASGLFPRVYYSSVRIGDYPWAQAQGDHRAPGPAAAPHRFLHLGLGGSIAGLAPR